VDSGFANHLETGIDQALARGDIIQTAPAFCLLNDPNGVK
jgi:hypothetical protein